LTDGINQPPGLDIEEKENGEFRVVEPPKDRN